MVMYLKYPNGIRSCADRLLPCLDVPYRPSIDVVVDGYDGIEATCRFILQTLRLGFLNLIGYRRRGPYLTTSPCPEVNEGTMPIRMNPFVDECGK